MHQFWETFGDNWGIEYSLEFQSKELILLGVIMVQWVDRNVIYHWHMLKCLGTDLSIMVWGKRTLKSSTGCMQLSQFPEFYTQELCNFESENCISIKKKNLTHLKNRWGKCGIILWKSRWVGMKFTKQFSLLFSIMTFFFILKRKRGRKFTGQKGH